MPATIVIVDDEPDLLLLLRIILTEKTDYKVLTTSDPHQAIDWCREYHADLLISDLRMPADRRHRIIKDSQRNRSELSFNYHHRLRNGGVRGGSHAP